MFTQYLFERKKITIEDFLTQEFELENLEDQYCKDANYEFEN